MYSYHAMHETYSNHSSKATYIYSKPFIHTNTPPLDIHCM